MLMPLRDVPLGTRFQWAYKGQSHPDCLCEFVADRLSLSQSGAHRPVRCVKTHPLCQFGDIVGEERMWVTSTIVCCLPLANALERLET